MHVLKICDPPIVEGGYNTGASEVVRQTARQFPALGHTATVVTKQVFAGVPAGESAYPCVRSHLDSLPPFDAVNIATEGRLGLLTLRYCLARGLRFTSGWYAQYAAFIAARGHAIAPADTFKYLSWFHNRADRVMVPTPSMAAHVRSHGVKNVAVWPFGVDMDLFRPALRPEERFRLRDALGLKAPVWVHVGRLDPEKGVDEFLALDLPGSKLVVGDGSVRQDLERDFAGKAVFVGLKLGEDLVRHYGLGDVFVMPSKSDSFGLVVVEALACGLKVAAYRGAIGPGDIVKPEVGCLRDDLHSACLGALDLDASAETCRGFAMRYSWANLVPDFIALQVPCGTRAPEAVTCRFEAIYGPWFDDLERRIVATEDTLFGAKAHNLRPDE